LEVRAVTGAATPATNEQRTTNNPEGNELRRVQQRAGKGQHLQVYKARRSCEGCPLAARCLIRAGAKYRTVKVGAHQKELAAVQARFGESEYQERNRHRGEAVETVFGYERGVWGDTRSLLRGRDKDPGAEYFHSPSRGRLPSLSVSEGLSVTHVTPIEESIGSRGT
jgi:hypothetical protein